MNKYEKAKGLFHHNNITFEQEKFMNEVIDEALEIADRLEQTMTDEQTADCIIVDVECVNNKHDKEVWMSGYNQALADIRGDNDGN